VERHPCGGGVARPLSCFFVVLALAAFGAGVGGCERSPEQARAVVEARRASWARDLGGLKEQQALLAVRFEQQQAGGGGSAATLRLRAMIDGARQSIVDVQRQLDQAATRMEPAARRNDRAGEQALDEESLLARQYLQSLGEQLTAAAQQFEQFSRHETESKASSL